MRHTYSINMVSMETEGTAETFKFYFSCGATKQKNEGWRLNRLLNIANSLAKALFENEIDLILFCSFYDHKGSLLVETHTLYQLDRLLISDINKIIKMAWESEGENSFNSKFEHIL